jgi:phosphatidylinositol glycan class O
VRDLDSNDVVVRQYLPQFLQETKTHLIVGHELGVDHCGHRFGPFHPAMTRKLSEVDEHVRKVNPIAMSLGSFVTSGGRLLA